MGGEGRGVGRRRGGVGRRRGGAGRRREGWGRGGEGWGFVVATEHLQSKCRGEGRTG